LRGAANGALIRPVEIVRLISRGQLRRWASAAWISSDTDANFNLEEIIMTQLKKSLLIRLVVIFLVGILDGCGGYRMQIISSNEASAILGLKVIYEQEKISYNNTKKYVTLDQLFSGSDAILSPSQSNPGYRFEARLRNDGESFDALANPVEYAKTGRRSFYINEQGVVHGADKAGADGTPTDPEVR
jgi:hypothetical protein